MHSFAIINGFRRNVKYFYKLAAAGKIVGFKSFENAGISKPSPKSPANPTTTKSSPPPGTWSALRKPPRVDGDFDSQYSIEIPPMSAFPSSP
jgi:hypothetical protein